MDCKKINPLILKYIENKISPEEKILLKEHIQKCCQCRAELMLYESTNTKVAANIEIPDSFDKNVMYMLDRDFNLNNFKLKLFYAFFAVISAVTGLFIMISDSGSLSQICGKYKMCRKYAGCAVNIESTFCNIKLNIENFIKMLNDEINFLADGFEIPVVILVCILIFIAGYMTCRGK